LRSPGGSCCAASVSLHIGLVLSLLACGALGCGGGSAAGDDASTCRNLDNGIPLCGPSSVEIPLEPGSASPLIAARIDGKDARVLIDTGAQDPIISSSFMGVSDAQWIRTHELCFGQLCLEGEQVYAQDTEFSQPDAGSTNGFIGMRTLRHFIVEFEHGANVRLTQGAAACAGSAFPLTFGMEGTPFVDVSVDGHDFPSVTVDSGSTFTVLSQASVAMLDSYVTAQGQTADLCTVNGCMTGVAFTSSVNEYCVFGSCEQNVPIKYPAFDAVGSSFLFLRDTAFDFPNSRGVFCQ
jgi:hypothetical protein